MSIDNVCKTYGIKLVNTNDNQKLFEELTSEFQKENVFKISDNLKAQLSFWKKLLQEVTTISEKMIENYFIVPVLIEVWQRHNKLSLWQGFQIPKIDKEKNTREPDFFISKKSSSPTSPYCIIGEAKKDDAYLYTAWGQCLEAMCIVQKINSKDENYDIPIYGIVSNGISWHFGKLVADKFVIAKEILISIKESSSNIEKILSILDTVFEECERNIEKMYTY